MTPPPLLLVWTGKVLVGKSDIDVHTYESKQNPKYDHGRDFSLWVGRDFFISQVISMKILHI